MAMPFAGLLSLLQAVAVAVSPLLLKIPRTTISIGQAHLSLTVQPRHFLPILQQHKEEDPTFPSTLQVEEENRLILTRTVEDSEVTAHLVDPTGTTPVTFLAVLLAQNPTLLAALAEVLLTMTEEGTAAEEAAEEVEVVEEEAAVEEDFGALTTLIL